MTAAVPGTGSQDVLVLAEQVVAALVAGGRSVATAESLTGGLVAAALTEVPGASAVVRGGVVSYATEVKRDVLGVPQELLERHGTVSDECAAAMAEGVRRVLGADWGVATTGVAGPSAVEGRPVGTVHVAVAGEHGTTCAALHLHGTRTEVRRGSVAGALSLLRDSVLTAVGGGRYGRDDGSDRETGRDTGHDGG